LGLAKEFIVLEKWDEKIIPAIITGLWDRREMLEKEIATDFSYYLWNLEDPQKRPVPQETLLNFGISIGRLMELDSALYELDPRFPIRNLDEVRASLYSKLP
jgi:hypothetical protein